MREEPQREEPQREDEQIAPQERQHIAHVPLNCDDTIHTPVAVHQVVADEIRAQAQCTAIFTKIILATTETSATTNAMNYPLDSAERILNSAGSMR